MTRASLVTVALAATATFALGVHGCSSGPTTLTDLDGGDTGSAGFSGTAGSGGSGTGGSGVGGGGTGGSAGTMGGAGRGGTGGTGGTAGRGGTVPDGGMMGACRDGAMCTMACVRPCGQNDMGMENCACRNGRLNCGNCMTPPPPTCPANPQGAMCMPDGSQCQLPMTQGLQNRCFCQNGRYTCPFVRTDGGTGTQPDAFQTPACAAGTMNNGACTMNNATCLIRNDAGAATQTCICRSQNNQLTWACRA